MRRQYELRLEEMLRREIHASVAGEVATLRGEVAALRNDLLEKVGGQIRLERIETTRLIGSDIEALQQEVQQLKTAHDGLDLGELVPRLAELVAEQAPAQIVQRRYPPEPPYDQRGSRLIAPTASARRLPLPRLLAAPVAAAPVVATTRPAVPIVRSTQPSMPELAPDRTPFRVPAPSVAPVASVASTPPSAASPSSAPSAAAPGVAPATVSASGADPFADLPRLTRFTDLPLDVPSSDAASAELDSAEAAHSGVGVRRAANGPSALASATVGRHSVADSASAGGRRRHEDGAGDDTLAHILERESADR